MKLTIRIKYILAVACSAVFVIVGLAACRTEPNDGHIHNLTHIAKVSASCEKAGNAEYWECKDCGKLYKDEAATEEIKDKSLTVLPALKHEYDTENIEWDWQGGYTDVTSTFTCKRDKSHTHTETATIDVETVPANCIEKGETTYTASVDFNNKTYINIRREVIELTKHNFGDWQAENATHHSRKCGYCKSTETKEHNFKENACQDCGYVKTETPPETHTHDLNHINGNAPTCTSAGNREYWYCGSCGRYFTDAEGINETTADNIVVHMIPHNKQSVPAKAATCTEKGWNAYEYCLNCPYTTKTEIPAKGHSFGEWTESGDYFMRECGVCHTSEYRDSNVEIRFTVENEDMGSIEGETVQTVRSGEQTAVVTAKEKLGYEFVRWSNGSTDKSITVTAESDNSEFTAYFRVKALALPVLTVETDERTPVTDKENYIRCKVSVGNSDYVLSNEAGGIRGRGNSTWFEMDKKPYRIKFDKKVDFFGNGAAKSWVLIANHCDKSLIRNYITYSLGGIFETQLYTTTTQYVELYFNGVYEGVYAVHEQTQTGTNRVEIDENFDENDLSFLLELDGRATEEGIEGKDWFNVSYGVYADSYAVKTPDTDIVTPAQIAKISNYISDAYYYICRDTQYGKYGDILNLLDVKSFAESYVINEFVKSSDIGFSSFYLYKDKGGKLCCGPLWDYDNSIGNTEYPEYNNPERLSAKSANTWFNNLLRWNEFRSLVAELLKDKSAAMMKVVDDAIAEAKAQKASFERNFERWDIMGKQVYREPDDIIAILTWEGQLEYARTWLQKSMAYLLAQYCDGNISTPDMTVDYRVFVYRSNGDSIEYQRPVITFYDAGGNAVASDRLWNDKVEARLPLGEYIVKLTELPEGYIYDESYTISPENGAYPYDTEDKYPTLTVHISAAVIKEPAPSDMTYKVNDVTYDFTAKAFTYDSAKGVVSETITLSGLLKTKKAVMLNFYFNTCPHSQAVIPDLKRAWEQYKDDIAVIMVNRRDNEDNIKSFCEQWQIPFYIVEDDYDGLSAMFGVEGHPSFALIDGEGVFTDWSRGEMSYEHMLLWFEKSASKAETSNFIISETEIEKRRNDE